MNNQNWNQLESHLSQTLNQAPEAPDAEVNASWDRLEPKLFPDKGRRVLWYSLSSFLLFLALGISAVVHHKSATDKIEIPENTKKNLLISDAKVGIETQSASPTRVENVSAITTSDITATVTQTVMKSDTKNAHSSSPSVSYGCNALFTSMPVAFQANLNTSMNKKESAKSESQIVDSEDGKSKHVEGDQNAISMNNPNTNSDNSNVQNALDMNSKLKESSLPIQKLNSGKSKLENNEIENSISLKNGKLDLNQVEKSTILAEDKIVLYDNGKVKNELIKKNGKTYSQVVNKIDTGNLVSIMTSKLVNDDSIQEVASISSKSELANNKVNNLSTLKDNIKEEMTNTKLRKPIIWSIYSSGQLGLKAAHPIFKGILGLETLFEINDKIRLIAGLRFGMAQMNGLMMDSSLSLTNMTVDSLSPTSSLVRMNFNKYISSTKMKQAQMIEIPIYVQYSMLKKLALTAGIDLSYLISVNTTYNSWSSPSYQEITIPTANVASYKPVTYSGSYDKASLYKKMGVSLHFGLQYELATSWYTRLAVDQMLKSYYNTDFSKQMNPIFNNPRLEIGVGVYLNRKKE